ISFRNEVMAVLSRAGCNQGICHGNLNGRGGFKLSLRGQDDAFDHDALTRGLLGRRANPQEPESSLFLLKATGQSAHAGGVRSGVKGNEYQILREWIAQGAKLDGPKTPRLTRLSVSPGELVLIQPKNAVTLTAKATFSNATTKDISSLAVFESTNPKI